MEAPQKPNPNPEELLNKKLEEFYNSYHLSKFQKFAVGKFLKDCIGNPNNHKVDRIRPWFFEVLNGRKCKAENEGQKGCPGIIPKLRGKPWWNKEDFPWLEELKEHIPEIREELLNLRSKDGFQPYRGPSWISDIKAKDGVGNESIDSGKWNVYYLFLHDIKFDKNIEQCPKTVEIIEKLVPRQYNHCFFSAMNPGTHIMKHHGPTNKKLRLHIPLIGVEGARMRVDKETRNLVQDEPYVFDDSFEHEAWHDGENTRLILIVDFWHPDLTNEEIKFLSLIQKAKMKYERNLVEVVGDEDNFYTVIDRARSLITDNEWWIQENE